ncbi:YD repeat-containing [Pyrenophora seminiperda CCB06]|uniref:YD repeat-containing n=1 Tax=Pyrenophora seminiperda CCB06 TaxID=1302712 RepID=A0A3M7MEC6_9PLEO|nr:YD repeat-containing [Pyrenophora seminiperda CCB06]
MAPSKDVPENGQYRGSQAFAHILPLEKETINTNTGSLHYSQTVVKLRGVQKSVDLTLSINYSDDLLGTFGFPTNWGFDLPYVLPGKTVTFQQRTYVIDEKWADSAGYKSGLRYLNDHGTRFQAFPTAKQLPSQRPGKYSYLLHCADGAAFYFDYFGKLLEQEDVFGNRICYKYVGGEDGTVLTQALASIQDSWNQSITFKYAPGAPGMRYGGVTITLPNQTSTTVRFDRGGVRSIIDPADQKTTFTCNDARSIITEIAYPTGLRSIFEYIDIQFRDTNGRSGYKAAVSNNVKRDKTDGSTYERTTYGYGTLSAGYTYTGFQIGRTLGGLQDSLMDGEASTANYLYDVYQISLDKDKKQISKTISWFNSLHLLVREEKYAQNSENIFVPVYMTRFTYPNESGFAHQPNYARVKAVERFHSTSGSKSAVYEPMSKVSTSYNGFGNVTTIHEELYERNLDNPSAAWVTQKSTTMAWYTVKSPTNGEIQMLQEEIVEDKVSKSKRQKEITLTANNLSIGLLKIKFCSNADSQQPQPWKEQAFMYDHDGRVVSQSNAWSSGTSIPTNSGSSVTSTTEYEFNQGLLREIKTDPSGHKSSVTYDVRINSGPAIKKTLPLGQCETFEYDRIGRLIGQTDALGQKTITSYSMGPQSNKETVTTALGHQTIKIMDCLGREVQVLDNGDPTQTPPQATRCLSQTTYDYLSRETEKIDRFGLTTTTVYDALHRPLSVKDTQGNTMTYSYDDATLVATEKLNGDSRTTTFLNGSGKVVKKIQYADSDDKSITYSKVTRIEYDGHGRKTKQSIFQVPLQNSAALQILQTEVVEYDADGAIARRSSSGVGDGGEVQSNHRYVFDLFGNTHSYSKETRYADGRTYTNQGPIKIYDKSNRLVTLHNQIGQEEHSAYDENDWLIRRTRFDGQKIDFSYDAAGQVVKQLSGPSSKETKYACFGRVSEVMENSQTIKYTHALDGTLASITHPDGKTQSYKLDKYSRIEQETDVFGTERLITFDAFGRVATRSCKGDQISYIYGRVNHQDGKLLGTHISGNRSLLRSCSYDGFGDVSLEKVENGDSVALETAYSRNARRQVTSIESKSLLSPGLNETRSFRYDGIAQLVQESTTETDSSTTTYTYDGNSNITTLDCDGVIVNMTYNSIDQRTDAGIKYDINGRMIFDDQNRSYLYDEYDRLLSINFNGDEKSKLRYYADNSLAQHYSDGNSTDVYHSSGTINAMSVTSTEGKHRETSVLFNGRHPVASYPAGKPANYFVDQNGSTALLLQHEEHQAFKYDAYGVNKTSSVSPIDSSFGYSGEFTDPTTGLVYLRSRFYSPRLKSFLSMDAVHTENRYAYCRGDPINLIDPSGNTPEPHSNLTSLIGAALISAGVTTLVASGMTPVVAAWGLSATATTTLTGMIGGAAGNVAFGGTHAYMRRTPYNLRNAGMDFLMGAATGGLSTYMQGGLEAAGRLSPMMAGVAAGTGTTFIDQGVRWVTGQQLMTPQEMLLGFVRGGVSGGVAAHFALLKRYRLDKLKGSMSGQSTRAGSFDDIIRRFGRDGDGIL